MPTISIESLEKTRDAYLVVAALIVTVLFAAAITVPSGLKSEKRSEQCTPLLIHEATFKVVVVTNVLAFILFVSSIYIHFGTLDSILSQFKFERQIELYRTQLGFAILGCATIVMVIAFSTGSYVILTSSEGLSIVSYLIGTAFFFSLCR